MKLKIIAIGLAAAQHLAGAAELVVANVAPLSGPLAANGLANLQGSTACIDEINAAGGINGNTLKLVSVDDHYKPEDTTRLLREVAEREHPVAFINLLGSANVAAVLKEGVLEHVKVPAVGVTPGADALRNPGSPWMFHVHASDTAQLRRVLSHFATLGLSRVGLVYQDIPFGRGGMKFIDEVAPSLKISVVAKVPVPSAAEDLSKQAAQLRKSGAQVYLMVLVPNSGASFVRDVRETQDTTPIYGMSYVPATEIIDKAGVRNSVGIGLAQVMPNPFSLSTDLVRHFHAAMDKYAGDVPHSQLPLVGYMSCRVLAEGLKKAGARPTPQKLQAALKTVNADLGGYVVDFAGGNVGSKYVNIGVVTKDGKLMY
jgi:ABC-type branched-subunit amino acid transport system substrate-binding protein